MNTVRLGNKELLSFIDKESIIHPNYGNRYILKCKSCGNWKILGKHCPCQQLKGKSWYKNLIDITEVKMSTFYRDSKMSIGEERITAIQNGD